MYVNKKFAMREKHIVYIKLLGSRSDCGLGEPNLE